MRQRDLANGSCRLRFLKPERTGFKAEGTPSKGNCTRRHEDHVTAILPQVGDVIRDRLQPSKFESTGLPVRQKG
jgi:hypothetical protein